MTRSEGEILTDGILTIRPDALHHETVQEVGLDRHLVLATRKHIYH